MTTNNDIFLAVNADCLVAISGTERRAFRTLDELDAIMSEFGTDDLMCSSDLDFPSEATSDPALFILCGQIRGYDAREIFPEVFADAVVEEEVETYEESILRLADAINSIECGGIAVGDVVRSFDSLYPERQVLEGELANYIIGRVVAIVELDGCRRYEIESKFRVSSGSVFCFDDPKTYYPPVNGTLTTGGTIMNGVQKI